jgi:hypothetical protein
MNATPAQPVHVITWRRAAIAVASACVVLAGALGAVLLSRHMMNSVALVGSWIMLTLITGCIVARFRPAVGASLLIGVGAGATVMAVFAGMGMTG